jgi:hypothetical protein
MAFAGMKEAGKRRVVAEPLTANRIERKAEEGVGVSPAKPSPTVVKHV